MYFQLNVNVKLYRLEKDVYGSLDREDLLSPKAMEKLGRKRTRVRGFFWIQKAKYKSMLVII